MTKLSKSQAGKADYWQNWFGRRVAKGRSYLESLAGDPGEATDRVHQTRKLLKRLRTGTRMLKGVADSDQLSRHRNLFRDAGRLLSASRDGTVRLATFRAVAGKAAEEGSGVMADLRMRLEAEAAEAERHAADGAKEALHLLKDAGVPDKQWRKAKPKRIRRNLDRLVRRTRDEFQKIEERETAELHEFRKRVKDLLYALQSLPGKPRGEGKRIMATLKRLQENLGLHHDLQILEEWLRDNGYGKDMCPQLWHAAEGRERKLGNAVMADGTVLEELGGGKSVQKLLKPSGKKSLVRTVPMA